MKARLAILLAAMITGAGLLASAAPAQAQPSRCYALWYERNEIYARNGYCFKTSRAIATFGRACFPPYGRLGGWEARRVRDIQDEEYGLACPQ